VVVAEVAEVEVAVCRLAERLAKCGRWNRGPEVGEGTGWRGDRDAVLAGRRVLGQVGGAVNADSRSAAAPGVRWDRDVDGGEEGRQELPEARGAFVAEHGTFPARQDRRQPSPLTAQPAMSDRIHPAMHTVQAAGARLVLGGVGADAGSPQLRNRHDAVLARSYLRDLCVPVGGLSVHTTDKSPNGRPRPRA